MEQTLQHISEYTGDVETKQHSALHNVFIDEPIDEPTNRWNSKSNDDSIINRITYLFIFCSKDKEIGSEMQADLPSSRMDEHKKKLVSDDQACRRSRWSLALGLGGDGG